MTEYINPRTVSCPTCFAPKQMCCTSTLFDNVEVATHIERFRKADAFAKHPSNNPGYDHAISPEDNQTLLALRIAFHKGAITTQPWPTTLPGTAV